METLADHWKKGLVARKHRFQAKVVHLCNDGPLLLFFPLLLFDAQRVGRACSRFHDVARHRGCQAIPDTRACSRASAHARRRTWYILCTIWKVILKSLFLET
jgi:hypothetical protein